MSVPLHCALCSEINVSNLESEWSWHGLKARVLTPRIKLTLSIILLEVYYCEHVNAISMLTRVKVPVFHIMCGCMGKRAVLMFFLLLFSLSTVISLGWYHFIAQLTICSTTKLIKLNARKTQYFNEPLTCPGFAVLQLKSAVKQHHQQMTPSRVVL